MRTPAPNSVRLDIPRALIALEPLIVETVKRLTRKLPNYRDDLEQVARVHLWRHALPRYDAQRGGQLEGFARRTVTNIVLRELSKLSRDPSHLELLDHDQAIHDETDPDARDIIAAITRDPESHLSPALARYLRALQSAPDRAAAAKLLGLTVDNARQLHRRLYARIKMLLDGCHAAAA